MENKSTKKSINKLIYTLLAAMLVAVVAVSIFTVSSRRRTDGTDTTSGDMSSTADTTSGSASTTDTTAPDTKSANTDTSAPADTADKTPSNTSSKPASADTEDVSASKSLRYFVMPAVGSVSKDFQVDVPVYSLTMNDYRAHTGVDIAAAIGSDVVAASSGTVCKIWNDPLMGRCVTIDHGDGIYTSYMNLAEELARSVEVGGKVSMGQSIGAVGESAIIEVAEEPHLHLEMKVNGVYVDPLEYMGVISEQDLGYEG